MTGFRLSWRIEHPTLIAAASISELGRSIQTPPLGGTPIETSSDHVYEAVLMVTDNFLKEIMLFLLFIIIFSYSYLIPTFYILIFHGNKENRNIAMLDIES